MKKILSNPKTAIILLIVTLLSLGFYTYMLVRPISYGMNYTNEIVYEGEEFEGTLKFRRDGKVITKNSNLKEEMEYYYYYKDGYVFSLMADTEEEYATEVELINNNFDAMISSPFYAAKINAFKQTSLSGDSDVTTYTCKGAIAFAIAGGVIGLALIALTAISIILYKKKDASEKSMDSAVFFDF